MSYMSQNHSAQWPFGLAAVKNYTTLLDTRMQCWYVFVRTAGFYISWHSVVPLQRGGKIALFFHPNLALWLVVQKSSYNYLLQVTLKIWRQKLIFLFFFSLKNLILGAHLLLLTFFGNFNFWTTLFSKMMSNFWRLLLNWTQDLKTF